MQRERRQQPSEGGRCVLRHESALSTQERIKGGVCSGAPIELGENYRRNNQGSVGFRLRLGPQRTPRQCVARSLFEGLILLQNRERDSCQQLTVLLHELIVDRPKFGVERVEHLAQQAVLAPQGD